MTKAVIETPFTTILQHGIILARYPLSGQLPDVLGEPAFWQEATNQLYSRMPFPTLWAGLRIELWDPRRPELEDPTTIPNVRDYSGAPGEQPAAGLQYPGQRRICLSVRAGAPSAARKTLAHESGHFVESELDGADDVSNLARAKWEEWRPHQGANEKEDFAEVWRAGWGHDEVIGSFSDGKPWTPIPELFSLVNCWFWLAGNLRGKKLVAFKPVPGGVMYQALIDGQYHWRFVDNHWRSQEYNGHEWVSI